MNGPVWSSPQKRLLWAQLRWLRVEPRCGQASAPQVALRTLCNPLTLTCKEVDGKWGADGGDLELPAPIAGGDPEDGKRFFWVHWRWDLNSVSVSFRAVPWTSLERVPVRLRLPTIYVGHPQP